jgi:hypothetical protein
LRLDWSALEGTVVGDPSVVAGEDGSLHLFARGGEGDVLHRALQCPDAGEADAEPFCSEWENLGGSPPDNPSVSDPVAVLGRGRTIPVVLLRADGAAWYRTVDQDWTSLGGAELAMMAVHAGADQATYLFGVDSGGELSVRMLEYPFPDAWLRMDSRVTGGVRVGVVPYAPPAPVVFDAGFESVILESATAAAPSGTPWIFSDNDGFAGIAGSGCEVTAANPDPPEGSQVGVLGMNASLGQAVVLPAEPCAYSVSLWGAQRGAATTDAQTIEIAVDGRAVGTFTPAGASYERYESPTFSLSAGAHTIAVSGQATGGDALGLVDDIRLHCWL